MTVGIYIIKNTINQKVYIGKSSNIEIRFKDHRSALTKPNRNPKRTNRYLYQAVQKYGIDNFEFEILQQFPIGIHDDLLKEAELYWMDYYSSCERSLGYNLRRDSSTDTFVHEDTRKLLSEINSGINNPNYGNHWTNEQKNNMSEIAKSRHACGTIYGEDWKKKIAESTREMWKDENKKLSMASKVSAAKTQNKFLQFDKITGKFIAEWESMNSILQVNTTFKRSPIYACCYGQKKSYRGFIWKFKEN
jgi:group I intron endonuclease